MEYSWMHAGPQDMSQEQERDATSGTGTGTGPGTRRSYECTFCKHGFTNAQALGGHMNIHRKYRAKKNKRNGQSRPNAPQQQPPAYSHVSDSHNGNPEHYQYQYPVSVPMSSEPLNYAATVPAAAFDAQGSYGSLYWPSTSEMPDQPPYGTMDDVSAGLSLGMGSGAAEEHYDKGVEKGDDDVDLELRL